MLGTVPEGKTGLNEKTTTTATAPLLGDGKAYGTNGSTRELLGDFLPDEETKVIITDVDTGEATTYLDKITRGSDWVKENIVPVSKHATHILLSLLWLGLYEVIRSASEKTLSPTEEEIKEHLAGSDIFNTFAGVLLSHAFQNFIQYLSHESDQALGAGLGETFGGFGALVASKAAGKHLGPEAAQWFGAAFSASLATNLSALTRAKTSSAKTRKGIDLTFTAGCLVGVWCLLNTDPTCVAIGLGVTVLKELVDTAFDMRGLAKWMGCCQR